MLGKKTIVPIALGILLAASYLRASDSYPVTSFVFRWEIIRDDNLMVGVSCEPQGSFFYFHNGQQYFTMGPRSVNALSAIFTDFDGFIERVKKEGQKRDDGTYVAMVSLRDGKNLPDTPPLMDVIAEWNEKDGLAVRIMAPEKQDELFIIFNEQQCRKIAPLIADGVDRLAFWDRTVHPVMEKLKISNQPNTGEITKVAVGDLLRAFRDNSLAASRQFGEKKLEVTGSVLNVREVEDTKFILVNLTDEDVFLWTVMCAFDEGVIDKLISLKKGDRITVRGLCAPRVENTVLGMLHCEFVD